MNINILAIDDVEANLYSLENLIDILDIKKDNLNLTVLKATSGAEGLKIAMNGSVDLIILDIQMPEMNGFEVAKFLKSNYKTKDIPIVFVTAAFKSEEFVKNGYELGAVDYFLKPIEKNSFLNRMKLYVTIMLKNKELEESETQVKLLNLSLEKRVREEVNKNLLQEREVYEKELELLRQNQEYESVFNYSQDGLGVVDWQGKFLKFNDAYINMLGYSKEEFLGQSCIELSIPEDVSRSLKMFEKLKTKRFVKNFEKTCVRKDGSHVHVSLSLVVLPDNERILINAKDLTVKKKLFNELMIAKINAENANAAQSKFLANMSHEIRTPMNGILGFSKILKDSLTNPVDVDHANMIETSAKMLLEIINDILDISKIQSGNMELDKQNFDLYDALVHTIRLYQVQAFEKNISFEIDIDETLKDLIIFSDAIKLKQVISNLLNNAIKFTPQYGMILFSSKVVETDKTSIKVRFSVKDNGIGISQDRQIIIFEPFRQENESTTREFGGTGLGLSICKEIVNMFGGDLLLMSQKDQGSEFYFEITFPFGEEVVSKQIVIDEKNSLIGKVLVAEDVEINQKLFKVLLAQKGFDSVFANNGLELVKIFKNQCDEFDMVFVDINMPIMDGLEALPELQTIKKQNQMSNPPIIALTANAIDGDKERYLELGFDAYLSKPIDVQVLGEILSKFANKN